MGKIYIGVDIGKDGFITIFNGEEFEFFEIPVIGKQVDASALCTIFTGISIRFQVAHAVLEDVHAIFGSSAKGTFTFGYVAGLTEMALVANMIPFSKVAPKKWQKLMWEGVPLQSKPSTTGKTHVVDTKAMSEIAAKRLFPKLDLRRNNNCKINHDGKIDSLLICEYARRNF